MTLEVKLEELKQRVGLPVFPVSAALGIALGPQHAQTGLDSAMRFLCGEVFKRKKSEREIRQLRRTTERDQLEKVFRATNNGLFTNTATGADLHASDSSVSLVDQQLDCMGASGHGDDFDGYEHSIAKGELLRYRDLTMKGKFWSLTGPSGAVANGEEG